MYISCFIWIQFRRSNFNIYPIKNKLSTAAQYCECIILEVRGIHKKCITRLHRWYKDIMIHKKIGPRKTFFFGNKKKENEMGTNKYFFCFFGKSQYWSICIYSSTILELTMSSSSNWNRRRSWKYKWTTSWLY
jgi:hypothetical protein